MHDWYTESDASDGRGTVHIAAQYPGRNPEFVTTSPKTSLVSLPTFSPNVSISGRSAATDSPDLRSRQTHSARTFSGGPGDALAGPGVGAAQGDDRSGLAVLDEV